MTRRRERGLGYRRATGKERRGKEGLGRKGGG